MARSGQLIAMLLVSALKVFGETSCDATRSGSARQNGEQAFRTSRFSDAAKSFEEAFKDCPEEHTLLLHLSEAQARGHRDADAIATAQRFLALEPASLAGKLNLANAYFMAQRFQEARRASEDVLADSPNDLAALKIRGNAEYLSGQTDGAIKTFLALLDGHPQDPDAPYMLGRIYYQEGRIEQASGQFQRALRLNGSNYKALDNLGLCYQALGDAGTAKRYFLTAIKVAKEKGEPYDWAYGNLANLLLENGNAEQAYSAALQATQQNTRSARNFYLGGKALQQLGKDDLSINWLERAAALDPNYPEPLYLLAKLYKERGQETKAAAWLDRFRTVKAATPRERK